MKPPDFLKNLPVPTRMLFRPMLMMSLVLHGAVLMLPIPSDLDKPKPPKKQEQVKITQLPRTRPSPKTSPQSSSKPNPQPSSQPSQLTPRDRPTRPEPVTTRQEPIVSLLPLPESSSPLQQQSKYRKEEPQQQLTEQPRRSLLTEQPKRSLSTEQPRRSESTKEPTATQSPIEPTATQPPIEPTATQPPIEPSQLPSTQEPTGKNEATGDSFTELFNKNQNQTSFNAALAQVEHDYKLEKFENDKLPDKFKDKQVNLDSKFKFLRKALPPLTSEEIASSLKTQLSNLGFGFNQVNTYEDGSLYEVTKGDFKRYLILAPLPPEKDEQAGITAIIVSQNAPR